MVEARVRVIYGDTDQMGVVYYANYFRYFELARSEWFRAQGGSYKDLEQQGALLPVVDARCSYHSPARYDDQLVIRVSLVELKRASLAFGYEIRRRGEDKLLCAGRTLHACIDREGRPVRLPQRLVELVQPALEQPAEQPLGRR